MATILPYIFLVEATGDPIGFRFRLVGTAISQWAAREYTGVWINELEYGSQWARIHEARLQVVRTGIPDLAEYQAPWRSREFIRYERMVAPLSSDGSTIDMLFGALHPCPTDGADRSGGPRP